QAANRVAEDAYRAGNLSIDRAQSLNLAVFESLTNALEHGCLGITYADKTREIKTGRYVEYLQRRSVEPSMQGRGITLTYRITKKWILVRIKDDGPGFKARDYLQHFKEKRTEDYHGRGVILLTSMVDRVRYNDSGNAVTLLMKRG
ncbi:MAG: ATP-binding protein, partial [Spirochaetia bacterium]|nr:ATP-binding protein [Spirochaetia bacterium]